MLRVKCRRMGCCLRTKGFALRCSIASAAAHESSCPLSWAGRKPAQMKGGFFMRKFSVNLRAMVLSGLLAAMGIVLQYFSITMPLMRIGISPVPIMVAGLVLGPVYGGITGLVKDTVGFLVAGQGSFFPPITVIQMLYGILPPLLLPLFRTPVHWVWDKAVRPDKVQRPA